MEVIQNLQATRPGIVHLFDEIVNTLPNSVHLTELSQNNENITDLWSGRIKCESVIIYAEY